MQPDPSMNPQAYPSGNPSGNPSAEGHFESHRTPAPAPTPAPVTSALSRTDAQTRGRATEQTLVSRIRETPQAIALARIVLDLRPEWQPEAVYAWALRDERPWTDVVQAAVAGALDRRIRHPHGLIKAGPLPPLHLEPIPPTLREIARTAAELEARDCGHGDLPERCPLCRRGIAPDDAA